MKPRINVGSEAEVGTETVLGAGGVAIGNGDPRNTAMVEFPF